MPGKKIAAQRGGEEGRFREPGHAHAGTEGQGLGRSLSFMFFMFAVELPSGSKPKIAARRRRTGSRGRCLLGFRQPFERGLLEGFVCARGGVLYRRI